MISGFLITRLLLTEFEKTGRVSLKLFYARRTLRLFPAAYVFIATMGLLSAAGVIHLYARDLIHAVSYTVNYLPDRSPALGERGYPQGRDSLRWKSFEVEDCRPGAMAIENPQANCNSGENSKQ